MLPNLVGAMSTSPVLINSLVGLFGNVHGGSFTEAQVQTVLLTDAVTNACPWAVAFHTALALEQGLDPEDVHAIREGRLPKDSKLAALSALAKTIDRKARSSRRSGRRSIHRSRFRQGSCPRGHRRRRRLDDHELYWQRHENASRGSVPGSRLVPLKGAPQNLRASIGRGLTALARDFGIELTLRHREDGAWRCDAVQRMRSERDQRRLRLGGERARDEDRSAERPA